MTCSTMTMAASLSAYMSTHSVDLDSALVSFDADEFGLELDAPEVASLTFEAFSAEVCI